MNYDEIIEDFFEEGFWDIVNKETAYLGESDENFQKCRKTCARVVKNNKLRLVLEEYCPDDLTKEEVKNLIEYIKADNERHVIENKRLLFVGAKYCYYCLEQMDLIKRSDL